MARFDPIALVEAAYSLTGDDLAWSERIVSLAVDELDLGFGLAAISWKRRDGVGSLERSIARAGRFDDALERFAFAMYDGMSDELVARYLSPVPEVESVSRYRDGLALFIGTASAMGLNVHDGFVMRASDGHDGGTTFGAFSSEAVRTSASKRARWFRIVAHVGAGLRLRRKFRGPDEANRESVAILDRTGSSSTRARARVATIVSR